MPSTSAHYFTSSDSSVPRKMVSPTEHSNSPLTASPRVADSTPFSSAVSSPRTQSVPQRSSSLALRLRALLQPHAVFPALNEVTPVTHPNESIIDEYAYTDPMDVDPVSLDVEFHGHAISDGEGQGEDTQSDVDSELSSNDSLEMTTTVPSLRSVSPSKSILKRHSYTDTTTRKLFRFNETVLVGEAYHKEDYDRKSDFVLHLTPEIAMNIKRELNDFKSNEMDVHVESRHFTHLFTL